MTSKTTANSVKTYKENDSLPPALMNDFYQLASNKDETLIFDSKF